VEALRESLGRLASDAQSQIEYLESIGDPKSVDELTLELDDVEPLLPQLLATQRISNSVCDIQRTRTDQSMLDGAASGAPDLITTYGYDNLGRLASQTQINSTTKVVDSRGHGSQASWSGGVNAGVGMDARDG
jgi:hypothetical protein